jgi:hypothetical protein
MSQPGDFDPLQPPPVQQPQEIDFSAVPPPPPAPSPTVQPTPAYSPSTAYQPPPKPFSFLAFLLGLLGTAILAVAGMMPMIPADAGPAKEKGQMKILVGQQGAESKVLFDKLGPDYEIRFDLKNWFMWAAIVMAAVNLWLTLIRVWAGYWIIGVGTIATVAALYFMFLMPLKVLPGSGFWALVLGSLILLLAAIIAGRKTRAARMARYQY